MAYLLLLLYFNLAAIVFQLGCVCAALITGIPIRMLGFFVGPEVAKFTLFGVDLSFGVVPISNSVKAGVPEDEDLPLERTSFQQFHPLARFLFHLAGPALVLATAALLVGPAAVLGHLKDLYGAMYSIVAGEKSIRQIGGSLLAFLSAATWTSGLAGVFVGSAASMLMPFATLPGGRALIDLASMIRPMSEGTLIRLVLLSFLLNAILFAVFLFAIAVPAF